VEEIDIWRTAKLLIDSHGENAWLEAAQRADYALLERQLAVAAVWTRIWRAVEALQQKRRRPSDALN